MQDLIDRFEQVKSRIKAACELAQRQVQPRLLAVSKKHNINRIKALAAIGQLDFGESYAQEGVKKINQLLELSLNWHFIGPIQSNKIKLIAPAFQWVHSVDRLKVLNRLNQYRGASQPPLNVLLQLKIGGELSKSGATYEEVMNLAMVAQSSEQINFRGLMCIPPASDDVTVQSDYFEQAKVVFTELANKYPNVDTLSMGMSGDLETAINTGATLVRIGTDIFGPRPT